MPKVRESKRQKKKKQKSAEEPDVENQEKPLQKQIRPQIAFVKRSWILKNKSQKSTRFNFPSWRKPESYFLSKMQDVSTSSNKTHIRNGTT